MNDQTWSQELLHPEYSTVKHSNKNTADCETRLNEDLATKKTPAKSVISKITENSDTYENYQLEG